MIGRVLAAAFGPRCAGQCGERVYPKDREWHWDLEHAGEPWPSEWAADARGVR